MLDCSFHGCWTEAKRHQKGRLKLRTTFLSGLVCLRIWTCPIRPSASHRSKSGRIHCWCCSWFVAASFHQNTSLGEEIGSIREEQVSTRMTDSTICSIHRSFIAEILYRLPPNNRPPRHRPNRALTSLPLSLAYKGHDPGSFFGATVPSMHQCIEIEQVALMKRHDQVRRRVAHIGLDVLESSFEEQAGEFRAPCPSFPRAASVVKLEDLGQSVDWVGGVGLFNVPGRFVDVAPLEITAWFYGDGLLGRKWVPQGDRRTQKSFQSF